MFYPAEMKRVAIGIHNSYRPLTVQDLHEAGILEIIAIRDEKSGISGLLAQSGRSPLIDTISDYILRFDRIFELFTEIPRPDRSLVAELLSPPVIEPYIINRRPLQELFGEIDEVLRELDQIPGIRDEFARYKEDRDRLEKEIETIEFANPLDFDLSFLGDSEFLSIIAGRVDTGKMPEFLEDIKSAGIDEIFISNFESGRQTLVLIALPASCRDEIGQYIRAPRFQTIEISYPGLPAVALAKAKTEYSDILDKIDDLLSELADIENSWNVRLLALYEQLKIEKEELELSSSCGESREVTFIEGWARADEVDRMKDSLEKASGGHTFVHMDETKRDDDDVPVDYNNPSWLKPFEVLTTTFARPLYHEIDPTPFIAPIFVIFFGLMMGDAAYGIIITLCGLFIYEKIGRNDPGIRDLSYILIFCGISASILGVIQGGWFGDVLPRYLGINPPFVILEPLKDPIAFFQLSLIIGVLHINLGLFLAFYQNVKSGAYKVMIFEQVVWFIIQPCAAVLLATFFAWFYIPPALVTVAEAGIVVGLVMIFYYRGAMGFFGLTGFLGDWLSYVRIMALSLATGGIAMTINILCQLIAAIHPLMIIIAALIFVGGQIFNLVIQSLGGVIHAIRLQYIEFFGKFYTGGGRKFVPFHAERRYTKLQGGDL
jgi:V/A-type H+-transporting ATPase subunit I